MPSWGRKKKEQALVLVEPEAEIIQRPAMTWEAAMNAWRIQLVSRTTRDTYASAVRNFFTIPGAPDLGALTIDHLYIYRGSLIFKAGKDAPPSERLSPSTVNVRMSGLKAFLLFCLNRRWLAPDFSKERIKDAMEGIKSQVQRPYQIVEQGDEMNRMLEAAEAEEYDPLRAQALVALALGAGLRVSELMNLNIRHVIHDQTGFFVDVQAGKGRKDRQVPISEDVYELLLSYIHATKRSLHRSADRDNPLFLTRKQRSLSGRLCTRHARRIIERCAERARLDSKHITPHGLRHSYAINLLAGDEETGRPPAPLPAVSRLLGHSNVTTTGRYLNHFERKDLAAFAPVLRRRTE